MRRVLSYAPGIICSFLIFGSTLAHASSFWGKQFKVQADVPAQMRVVRVQLTQGQIRSMGLENEMNYLRSLSLSDKIKRVHMITRSAIRERNDGRDIWRTPWATWQRRAGDCEDFAVLRMELLRLAGVPRKAIAVFTGWNRGQGHAVTAVSTSAGTWVLDNLRSQAYLSSQPRSFRPSLGINATGVWYIGLE